MQRRRRALATWHSTALMLLALCGCGDGTPDVSTTPPHVSTYDSDGHLLGATSASRKTPPNLIVIVIDTLRRDAVALDDDEQGVMPHLASLARSGVAFTNATSPASWTVPAIGSLLTGLLPHEHTCDMPVGRPSMPSSIPTYAEALRNGHGYETAAFTNIPWFQRADDSLLQGFAGGSVGEGFALQGTRERVGAWARQRTRGRPFFLLLHSFEAHDPYGARNHPFPDSIAGWEPKALAKRTAAFDVSAVREPWQMVRTVMLDNVGRRALGLAHGDFLRQEVARYTWRGYRDHPRPDLAAELRQAYFGGVAWLDGVLANSIRTLDELGLLENTLLVVTSDHGEAFGEHGMLNHGRRLDDELIRVPLVLQGPGPFGRGRTITQSVGLIDILPTFFDWAGLPAMPETRGRSLLPLLRGASQGHPVVSEERVMRHNTEPGVRRQLRSVRNGKWKYLIEYDMAAGTVLETVFDLAVDPAERDALAADGTQHYPWGDEFCRCVEEARDHIWDEIKSRRALKNTIYGGRYTAVTTRRPDSCSQPSRE